MNEMNGVERLVSKPLALFNGIKIIENRFATATKQIKTHRKKRINKKWRKKYGTKQVPAMYMVAGDIVAHPEYIKRMNEDKRIVRMVC